MIDRFHHLFIAPADFDASLAFYRDTLGWKVVETWGDQASGRGAVLSGGAIKVVLGERAAGVEGGHAAADGRANVHLDIHDIDARFRALPAGSPVVTPPGKTAWGTRWFVVRDPDGNLIAYEELHGGR